jgi:hypothetical protein
MRNILVGLLTASVIGFTASSAANAMPLRVVTAPDAAQVVLVRDACGVGSHRGPMGVCRPNSFPVRVLAGALGGACPPTYHLGPMGNRCWSDF